MVMDMSKMIINKLQNELPPLVEAPPAAVVVEPRHSTHQSIQTLVVVIAVITILGVIAGIIARLCGGRHFGGSGEHDIEGWVERKCRSCIDAGVPSLEAGVFTKCRCWTVTHMILAKPEAIITGLSKRASPSTASSPKSMLYGQQMPKIRPSTLVLLLQQCALQIPSRSLHLLISIEYLKQKQSRI